jgi:uncharacterized membrane protein YedE/YeeE
MSNARAQATASFVAGLLFALGLGLGGMTLPSKVIGFLSFHSFVTGSGRWDPSLAFVMIGAVSVYALVWRRVRAQERPKLSAKWFVPTRADIDPKLLAGAALFGVGWGLGGYCPGPAIVSSSGLAVETLTFTAAMLAGMYFVVSLQWRAVARQVGLAETSVSPSPASAETSHAR